MRDTRLLEIGLGGTRFGLFQDLQPGLDITDRALKAGFGDKYQSIRQIRGREWFLESREPGVMYLGYERPKHYLRLAVRYDDRSVEIEIVESRNLKQRRGRIHKNALVWVQRIETRVRRALGEVVAMKANLPADPQTGAIPAAPAQ